MDPHFAWDLLLDTYVDGEWEAVAILAEDLLAWMSKGGFPPRLTVEPRLDERWQRAIAEAACRFALAVAQEHLQENPCP